MVATDLDARAGLESVLVDTAPYWQHHCVADLPPRVQLRLGELAGAEHHRASEWGRDLFRWQWERPDPVPGDR